MVWCSVGTSCALTLRRASRSRFSRSSGNSFMGSLLCRGQCSGGNGSCPGVPCLRVRRGLPPAMPLIETAQLFPASGQARLDGRGRHALHSRDLVHGEVLELEEHDRLALLGRQRGQRASHAIRAPALFVPRDPVVPGRLAAGLERPLDRHRCAPGAPQTRAVPREEDREEPRTELGLVAETVHLLECPKYGLLVEIVALVGRPAQPAARDRRLHVDRREKSGQSLPANRVCAGFHRPSALLYWVPKPETLPIGQRSQKLLLPEGLSSQSMLWLRDLGFERYTPG